MLQIKTRYLFTFLIILLADISFSQKRQEKTQSEFQPKSAKLSFNQELNIYQWNYLLNYKKSINNHLDVNINEIFTSTLQNVASTDLWKDDQNLSIAFRFPLKANLSANAEFDSHILKDPLAGFDNDVTYNSGTASLTYT